MSCDSVNVYFVPAAASRVALLPQLKAWRKHTFLLLWLLCACRAVHGQDGSATKAATVRSRYLHALKAVAEEVAELAAAWRRSLGVCPVSSAVNFHQVRGTGVSES